MDRTTIFFIVTVCAYVAVSSAAHVPHFHKIRTGQDGLFLANYFPNWAQYRTPPATYGPDQMKPVMDKFSYVVYAFAWMNGGCDGCNGPVVYDQIGQCQFSNGTCTMYANGTRDAPECPVGATPCDHHNFTLVSPEPKDDTFYKEVIAMKASGQKILLSVGGWNFPSGIWSTMVADPNNRKSFISSVQDFMERYGFDGIDLDWEYWCSSPRGDNIKITNSSFHLIYDIGGKCPDDGQNVLTLVTELRAALGEDKMITVATQADLGKMKSIDVAAVSAQIDYWHLMAYDYSVSDLPEMCGDAPCFANFTAPNQPLYAPKQGEIPQHDPIFPSSYWSVNYTITGYIAAGAPKEKLVLGLTFYGHHWYIPNQQNWQQFGVQAQISSKCYGPFKQTYGAWAGHRARLCGLLIYSEIQDLIDETDPSQNYFDPVSMSDIGYIKDGSKAGEDLSGATPAWVSWNSIKSLEAMIAFSKEAGIAGVFAFDSSMDQFDKGDPVVNALYKAVHGGSGGSNVCDPSKGCNVCSACCKSYIKDQTDCDACVKQECPSQPQCDPSAGCTACTACCKSYLKNPDDCAACVKAQCPAKTFRRP